ncbi:hypothetical protein AAFC00_004518 [Neodothiora populina]|uniref:Major facilitator superfamily (MFS) profile domain-containing protein n=1 Tax=Neodothiora populina TaxID=2781224 RepID=A0ABR3P2L2_9PEZI
MSVDKERHVSESPSLQGGDWPAINDRTKDDALDYLQQHKNEINAALSHDAVYMKRLRRKIDIYVISFLTFCYIMNFLDKILLNYAKVMGLTKDAHLHGQNFSNASSAFFIAVLIMTAPNIFLLQRLPAAKYLGATLFLWGIATASMASVHNYGGLLTVRIFCGIFESAIPPSLMLISSQWYTRKQQASRFALWYMGIGLGQVLGGLISWAFQHVSVGASLAGWRIMFVVLGCVTLVVSTGIFFLVPDTPMQAWFLKDEEKVALLEHVKVNQTGIENRHFVPSQIVEGFCDLKMYGLGLIMCLQGTGGGVVTTYSATILKGYGYTSERTALLNMGTGAVTCASTLLCGYGVRYFGHRWAWIIAMTIPTIIGAGLMAWLPTTNKSGALAGVYLVNTFLGTTPIIYQWFTANTAGHTKRAFGSAVMNGAFAIGNIIGPQTFQDRDAPGYQPAKIAMVALQAAVILVCVLLFGYLVWENKKRAQKSSEDVAEVEDAKAYAGLTDKQNLELRYEY